MLRATDTKKQKADMAKKYGLPFRSWQYGFMDCIIMGDTIFSYMVVVLTNQIIQVDNDTSW